MSADQPQPSNALKRWELENNVQEASASDMDALYRYDADEQKAIQDAKPWKSDPHYFKRVRISALALLKMAMHAKSGGNIEVMGVMQGKIQGNEFIVVDTFALPVEGTETRVNAGAEAYEYMVDFLETTKASGRFENLVGWYHSHPGYGCWLSGIDVGTQMTNQKYQEPFLAIVVDPHRTVAAGKVEIGAFRTFPEGYKPPEEGPSEYQTIPLDKIEDFGVHCKQYYSLDISFFKSSLDSHLLDLLWNKYWVSALSSNPLLGTRDLVAGQLADIGKKLEAVESQVSTSGRLGRFMAAGGKKGEDGKLEAVVRDTARVASEQIKGLSTQVIKELLLSRLPPRAQGSGMADPLPHAQHSSLTEEDEDEVVEQDPTGRYSRYREVSGRGRFKTVYKGFDEKQGIDVAWSKIEAGPNNLSHDQMRKIVDEISYGLGLDHPHVIKCFQCWEDAEQGCINMITEFFTSGSLREYRQRHKSLDVKAVKKWGRQILQGLAYLHNRQPPVVHGDLRLDKIYINGHSGEIKIGDLGLAVLAPRRFAPGVMPEGDPSNQYTRSVDIFAYGLLMLELVTGRKVDRTGETDWQERLAAVADPAARAFIARCLAPVEQRPAAHDLLDEPFLQPPKKQAPAGSVDQELIKSKSDAVLQNSLSHEELSLRGGRAPSLPGSDDEPAACEAGTVRGEDYCFTFTGKLRDGKLHFRLHMQWEGDGDAAGEAGSSKTIDFVYDPDSDTPDEIAAEISNEFHLSDTDRDICAAALKEWLDRGMDAQQG
ncbi:COP9 signalosome complex subunit 5b-like [Chlorella sorokiniana]|uniref:non-specific serine/threonine protein kinase n=1 Tax=Chlorella sorokiniana TaxID=3076 RepID=A0A2P6TVV7_CHLSO|nr:COP9 signalosome complex subunit 5b-like [Chlorella sorokiniana]|eukprot:PRW58194.1 COP9 signalosome complex subunit 5b-like [Chlorella sorokiniana]